MASAHKNKSKAAAKPKEAKAAVAESKTTGAPEAAADAAVKQKNENKNKKDKKDKKSKPKKTESKKANTDQKPKKTAEKEPETGPEQAPSAAFPVIAETSEWDKGLASLFALPVTIVPTRQTSSSRPVREAESRQGQPTGINGDDSAMDDISDGSSDSDQDGADVESEEASTLVKKRKRDDQDDENLEARYFEKISRQAPDAESEDEDEDEDEDGKDSSSSEDEIPLHETLTGTKNPDEDKNERTIFLGNVPSAAVNSKKDKKAIIQHIRGAFSKDEYKVESIRFRSTPYTSGIPKRASFAKGDVLEATSHSTNAYAVLSHVDAVREAARKLNGSVLLSRHIRVDSAANPAPVNHRKCVFVGNLGYFDDDSAVKDDEKDNISEKTGKPKIKRKPSPPADYEEGLWRTFGEIGTVDSVRVIRDGATRVGKGFAYVQFKDENSVEQALLLDGKTFPPLLPRKLRIARAKSQVTLKRQKDGQDRKLQGSSRKAGPPRHGGGGRPDPKGPGPKRGTKPAVADSRRSSTAEARPSKRPKTSAPPEKKNKLTGSKLERAKSRTDKWRKSQPEK